jgi:uncharacterized protein
MTITELPITVDTKKVTDFCRERGIKKLSIFGSVLREDFSPSSDVDVLVEFLPGKVPGLAFFGYADQLADLFGRRVDLITPAFLNRHFRNEVLSDAITLYEQT